MNAGALNKLLTVQVKTVTTTYGSAEETWADLYADIPCAIQPVGSREFPTNIKRNSEAQVRFVVRYRAGIDAAVHQITTIFDYDASPQVTRTFNIFPPQPLDAELKNEGRVWLAIEAIEVK